MRGNNHNFYYIGLRWVCIWVIKWSVRSHHYLRFCGCVYPVLQAETSLFLLITVRLQRKLPSVYGLGNITSVFQFRTIGSWESTSSISQKKVIRHLSLIHILYNFHTQDSTCTLGKYVKLKYIICPWRNKKYMYI